MAQSGRSMLCKSHCKFSAFAGFVQIGDSASRKVTRNRSPRLTSRPIDLLHTEVRVNRFRLSLMVFSVACFLAVNIKSVAVDKRPLRNEAYSISGIQASHQRLGLSSELLAKANSPQELTKRAGSIGVTTQRSSIRQVSKSPTNRLFKCLKRFRRLCRSILPRTPRPDRKSRQSISAN
jgi:hypothetical protein